MKVNYVTLGAAICSATVTVLGSAFVDGTIILPAADAWLVPIVTTVVLPAVSAVLVAFTKHVLDGGQ